MISRQSISGFFFITALYLVYSNYLIPGLISMGGATLMLKLKNKPNTIKT